MAGSLHADGTVAERVILVSAGHFAGVDADTAREGWLPTSSYIPKRAPLTKRMSWSRCSMPSLAKMR